MSRYFSRPRALWVEDDLWDEPVNFGAPEVPEHVATNTGLLDQHGNTIWRAPNPIGFQFETEEGRK